MQIDFLNADKDYQEIMLAKDIDSFLKRLSNYDCKRCSLSEHKDNQIVIYRGNPNAEIVLVGEAPGMVEAKLGEAFVGPAGVLADKIFASVNIDTNKDMFLGNICLHRPVAEKGSGKQNYTPYAEQTKLCKPYILKMIELINPKIVIAFGRVAAINLFKLGTKTRMKHIVGKFFQDDSEPVMKDRWLYTMYHSSYLLRVQYHKDAQILKQEVWNHVKLLRSKAEELNINFKETYIA